MRAAPDHEPEHREEALARERARMVRGLLLLGLLVLVASIARAGLARVFYSGWWRQW